MYSTVSGRRFMSDLRDAYLKEFVKCAPCYNSIFNVFERDTIAAILLGLIVAGSLPLKAWESSFACDSSGFSASRFDRWFDHKHGKHKIRRAWVKGHIMCGVRTNVVTAVEIRGPNANDAPLLPSLLHRTDSNFHVSEVSADLGYSSRKNLKAIATVGAEPFIPFKSNATAGNGGLWAEMFHAYHGQREAWNERYHLRSNVESTFAMIKAKFGDSVRNRTDTAMKNEVLAKILCHNICCVIRAQHEMNFPRF